MTVNSIQSGDIYLKIMNSPLEKKNDIFRYELMKPFQGKWDCYHIPLKAPTENGYDIVMASGMMGLLTPKKINAHHEKQIRMLSSQDLWKNCQKSIERSLACFTDRGITLPIEEYLYSIFLADPENPYTIINENYCGDGGIPGYIMGWLVPDEYTLGRLPVALAHETNHNVRFQFEKWHDDITLAEMMVSEGLAENFATHLYGEENLGPWVAKTDLETLNTTIKPIIQEGLLAQGLENITAYLYGDEMAKMQNYFPVGLPYCAGYACGYYLIRHYLKKTGKDIVEATLTPTTEIMDAVTDFWNNK